MGTDGSPTAMTAVETAAELARCHGAALHVVHAYGAVPAAVLAGSAAGMASPAPYVPDSRQSAEAILKESAGALPGLDPHTHARPGGAAEAIADVAEEVGADLIVVGNRGMQGMRRFLLGSVPNRVAHSCPCSILIVNTV